MDHPRVIDRIRIFSIPLEDALDLIIQLRPAGIDHPPDLLLIDHRHNTGCDRNIDPGDLAVLYELVVIIVVKEKL